MTVKHYKKVYNPTPFISYVIHWGGQLVSSCGDIKEIKAYCDSHNISYKNCKVVLADMAYYLEDGDAFQTSYQKS